MKGLLLSLVLVFLFLQCALGQTLEKKKYQATPISIPPGIDGILDDAAWQSGTWADDFTQNEPYSGRKASQQTEYKVLFDEDNLYVAIKAYDTSVDSIVKRLSRRDEVDGDLAGIFLDSFHDLRTAFLFGVSSAGVKYDEMYTNDGQNQDASWNPNWWVRTSVSDEGWIAEMKIPFSQVRFEKNSGDVWGFNIVRYFYRNDELDFWQHIPKEAPGMIHLFGEITGLEQIKPRKIFDITPYGVVRAETFEAEPENPFRNDGKSFGFNGGVDAKIGVTNNMTMDLTINPDFGQVEADPSEVNLSAYETFFPEKRPFFIEGNNITDFNLGIGNGGVGNDNLFYSRRIGRVPHGYPDLEDGWNADVPTNTTILGAAKLTGKSKKGLSIGFINALTAEEIAEIDTIGGRKSETVEPLTNYFIGRVQKDIKEGNTIIGGIFTGTNRQLNADVTDMMHKAAYSGGLDFTQYFKDKSWMFNLNAAYSRVEGSEKALEQTQRSSAHYYQRPDKNYAVLDTTRTSLNGSGGRMQLMKMNGKWNYIGAILWKTPGFETNDLGYLRQADQVLSVLWAGFNQYDPKGIYRSYNINADIYTVWNFGGDPVQQGFEGSASMNFKNFWSVFTSDNVNSNSLSTGILRGGPMMKVPGNWNLFAGFSSDNRKKLGFSINSGYSKGFENYSKSSNYYVEISYKPVNFLSFTLSPGYSRSFSELQYVSTADYNGMDRYIFASIDRETVNASFRINLNVSPDLTLQYWGQPFVATGKYYEHKYITDPMADNYHNRFSTYTAQQITLSDDEYDVDENVDGTIDYSFDRSDFNVQEFLSNLVIRWEYNPGSTLYLVWSQTRYNSNNSGNLELSDDLGNLFDSGENKPHNIFLIKLSYRLGLR
jgi:hypothetical protein